VRLTGAGVFDCRKASTEGPGQSGVDRAAGDYGPSREQGVVTVRGVSRTPSAPVGWQHFAHDADIGVRGRGRTIAEPFEQTALALTAVRSDRPASLS
jgi:hypothetical protein